MRITERRLRRVIREVIKESSNDDQPGDISSHEYYPDMGIKQSDATIVSDHELKDTVLQSREDLERIASEQGRDMSLSSEVKSYLKDIKAAVESMLGMGSDLNVRD